jgi:hypothetical protein
LGSENLSVRRSTIAVASSTIWLRVAKITMSGSPSGSDESMRISSRGLPALSYRRSIMVNPFSTTGAKRSSMTPSNGVSMSGASGLGSPATSSSVGLPVATVAQTSDASPWRVGSSSARSCGAATQSRWSQSP